MSKKVTVAAVQMTYGLENALAKVREAASQGAQIILLPELFENWYFCQEKSYENYHLATTLEENPAVCELRKIAHDFRVVLQRHQYRSRFRPQVQIPRGVLRRRGADFNGHQNPARAPRHSGVSAKRHEKRPSEQSILRQMVFFSSMEAVLSRTSASRRTFRDGGHGTRPTRSAFRGFRRGRRCASERRRSRGRPALRARRFRPR